MSTKLLGKDATLEATIKKFTEQLTELGLNLEFTQELNPAPNIYSCILKDKNNPKIISTNGKGASYLAAKASALGEMAERFLNQSFFDDQYLGKDIANLKTVRYPNEVWIPYPEKCNASQYNSEFFEVDENDNGYFNSNLKAKLPNDKTLGNSFFTPALRKELEIKHYLPFTDTLSSNYERGICTIPLKNELNSEIAYFPISYLEGCYCTNGMCAGNSEYEAKVQGLSEIFERFVRKFLYGQINSKEHKKLSKLNTNVALPEIPLDFIEKKYPKIFNMLTTFEDKGFKVVCYDASLNLNLPVVAVGVYHLETSKYKLSLGAHPNMELALERTITELMQGVDWNNLYLHDMSIAQILGDYANDIKDAISSALSDEEDYDENDDNFNEVEYDEDLDNDDIDEGDNEDFDGDDYLDGDEEYTTSNFNSAHVNKILTELDNQYIYDFHNFINNFDNDSGKLNSSFFNTKSNFTFKDWSLSSDNTKDQFDYMLNILKALNKDIWCYDCSYKDMYAYRLIVPNFSEIYRFNYEEFNDEFSRKSFIKELTKFHELTIAEKFELLDNINYVATNYNKNLHRLLGVYTENESLIEPFSLVNSNELNKAYDLYNLFINTDFGICSTEYKPDEIMEMYTNNSTFALVHHLKKIFEIKKLENSIITTTIIKNAVQKHVLNIKNSVSNNKEQTKNTENNTNKSQINQNFYSFEKALQFIGENLDNYSVQSSIIATYKNYLDTYSKYKSK